MGTCHPAAFSLHVLLFYFYFFKNETSRALTSVASILAMLLNFIITHSFLVATLLHDIFFFYALARSLDQLSIRTCYNRPFWRNWHQQYVPRVHFSFYRAFSMNLNGCCPREWERSTEVKYIENITWPYGDTKFIFECCKIFEIFYNTRKEILYFQVTIST